MPELQEPTFDFLQLGVLCLVALLFFVGSKANDIFSVNSELTNFESLIYYLASFLLICAPLCRVVYEALISSRDLFVWLGAVVPPVTAGFTARTQMAKISKKTEDVEDDTS